MSKKPQAVGTEELTFPKRPFKTFGGVHVPHRKNTAFFETETLPTPEKVIIPMQMHIGAPCEPCVKVGDKVRIGQPIGESSAFVSAPIHASVAGTVKAIGDILMPNGVRCKTVEIVTEGEEQIMWEGIKPPVVTNQKELVDAVRKSGLVGLGGAGFPVSVKLSIGEKKVDTIVINGAECEPYLTADMREMLENTRDVIDGIAVLRKFYPDVKRVIIGVESNKPTAIECLSRIAEENDPEDVIRVLKLKASYPQGAEKVLIQACTGRRVPKGKLPLDVGCIVMNITSVAFLARYLKTGIPLISKRVTVDGSSVLTPKNVQAPIGTPIGDLLKFCGGYKEAPRKILMGGPMMGNALYDTNMPIIKQTNGLLAMAAKDVDEKAETECIRCGRCVAACPMRLQATSIERAVKIQDCAELERLSVNTCMECGCCAFSCPAKRPLVQYMRLGKTLLRNNAKK